MDSLTFIHAADLHLGSTVPEAYLASDRDMKTKLENSGRRAIEKMVDNAITSSVDFIILAGDLFDQQNRSIKSQLYLKKQFERLHNNNISVYIVFGNHDPVNEDYFSMNWPDNVNIFDTKPELKIFYKGNKAAAHLYGCSYPRSSFKENIAAGYLRKEGAPYHIGILHGQLRQNHDHLPYAPFDLQDLTAKHFDYWALGHIHKRLQLAENICYPGSIQGRSKKETGEKGYLLISLNPVGTSVTFHPAADIAFERLIVDTTSCSGVDDLTEAVFKASEKFLNRTEAGFWIELQLTGCSIQGVQLKDEEAEAEWLEVLNESGKEETPFLYFYNIINNVKSISQLNSEAPPFLIDIERAAEEIRDDKTVLEKHWKELLQHSAARKYMASIPESEKDKLIEEAHQWIVDSWWRRENHEDN
ncbi:exonuclease SbcCD subunit D [Alteribacillus sp. HJP-4]|uniref:metallophosphoesterase family protein n=1 Tax=Alteribacillus sp. HJP-4 TaxID=2775394 RepID=UPI0035CCC9B9